jgi:hypothetical protein
MDGTVLVEARNGARQVASLGMKCGSKGSSKEIPQTLSDTELEGWWLVEKCMFGGSAVRGGETKKPSEPVEVLIKGTAALAVGEGRIIGILDPMSTDEPELWWSWPLSTIKVETEGSRGLLKKRPAAIRLDRGGGADADGDSLVLIGVNRLFPNSGRAQPWQEKSLLEALSK